MIVVELYDFSLDICNYYIVRSELILKQFHTLNFVMIMVRI